MSVLKTEDIAMSSQQIVSQYLSDSLKETGRKIRKNWSGYLFLLPYMIFFITFVILPVFIAIYYGFSYYNIIDKAHFIGFDNYVEIFLHDDIFSTALKNTLLLAVITGPIGYLASMLFAWFVNELNPKLRAVFVVVFYAPSLSGAVYLVWSLLFSGDAYGVVNNMLICLGFADEPLQFLTDSRYMFTVLTIMIIWSSLGTGFLSFVAGFQGLDKSLFEAGMVDGIGNRWQELWYITLPSIRPQMMFGAVMAITTAFGIGDQTVQLFGLPSTDYAVHTVINHIQDYGTVRYEMGYACALASILFVMMFVCNIVIQKFLKGIGNEK